MSDPRETMDDRGMILDPEFWPRWPLLPVKRYPKAGGMECGFLVAAENVRWTVFLESIYGLAKYGQSLKEVAEKIPNKIEYADLDALLADGWIVD